MNKDWVKWFLNFWNDEIGGPDVWEIARRTGLGPSTVRRHWRILKARLMERRRPVNKKTLRELLEEEG